MIYINYFSIFPCSLANIKSTIPTILMAQIPRTKNAAQARLQAAVRRHYSVDLTLEDLRFQRDFWGN
jgi:hypothetical protein